MWQTIAAQISAATGEEFVPRQHHSVGGGCINAACRLEDGNRRYFVKLNDAPLLDMFEAEAEGLREIARTNTVSVPQPVALGTAGAQAFLVLEYLELGGRGGADALGHELAAMHRCSAERYGWHRDNTIGSTPQSNRYCDDWVRFWQEQRLGAQLELAAHNGYRGSLQQKGQDLLRRIPALFTDYSPGPSLLHGDLWSGNWAVSGDGQPVIFDPAVYFGDRETDLAMTELFGGFGPAFYAAYNEAWPLDAGYPVRKLLYNLYHILNHLNLFGGGYGSQAESMMGRLLAEIR